MEVPQVIMLFGNKEVGKTTSAKHLYQHLTTSGYMPDLIAFADPIKSIAVDAFGLPRNLVFGSADDKNAPTSWKWAEIKGLSALDVDLIGHSNLTIREFLQFIGTELFRKHFHPKVWDKLFWDKIRGVVHPKVVFICHDGRHHSEMEIPEDFTGKTYKILIKRETGHQDGHSSEKQLHEMPEDCFDKVIINDGTIEQLYTKLGHVMQILY